MTLAPSRVAARSEYTLHQQNRRSFISGNKMVLGCEGLRGRDNIKTKHGKFYILLMFKLDTFTAISTSSLIPLKYHQSPLP